MPVIHFSWSAFTDTCDVLYCDVTQRVSFWFQAFNTFSQIGGFSTVPVAIVVVRVVLWPLCTFNCSWYHSKGKWKAMGSNGRTDSVIRNSTQLSTLSSGEAPLFESPASRTEPV